RALPPPIGAARAPAPHSAGRARPCGAPPTGELLADHPGVPVNRAVSVCTVRSNLWLQVACPEPSTGAVPTAVVPSKNVTEPTGTTDVDVPTTVAVRVMRSVTVGAGGLTERSTAVSVAFTVWLTWSVAVPKPASPEQSATTTD